MLSSKLVSLRQFFTTIGHHPAGDTIFDVEREAVAKQLISLQLTSFEDSMTASCLLREGERMLSLAGWPPELTRRWAERRDRCEEEAKRPKGVRAKDACRSFAPAADAAGHWVVVVGLPLWPCRLFPGRLR